MPSGKQVLIDILSRLAVVGPTGRSNEDMSEDVRAGLLLHGSTADDSWPRVDAIHWASEMDDQGVVRQGIALKWPPIFLADLLETMTEPDEIPQDVTKAYPNLQLQEYRYAIECMWLILSSLQWFRYLSVVEKNNSDAERKYLISSLREKLIAYRRDPNSFLG